MAARRTQRGPTTSHPEGATAGRWTWLTVVVLVGVAPFLVGGVWAFLWPHSFYESVATFPPFNLHLFHDVGAFQLGIAAAMIGGLIWRDALAVGLFGGWWGRRSMRSRTLSTPIWAAGQATRTSWAPWPCCWRPPW